MPHPFPKQIPHLRTQFGSFEGGNQLLTATQFLWVLVQQLICSTSTCKHVQLISHHLAVWDSPFKHPSLQQFLGEGADRLSGFAPHKAISAKLHTSHIG